MPPCKARGFTLVELMIAVTIAAIIFATIGTGLVQVSRGASSLEASGEARMAMGEALEWMRRDLEALYIEQRPLFNPEGSVDGEDPYRFVLSEESEGGETVSMLRFTSRNHLAFGENAAGGIAEIVYYVAESDEGLVLKRSDRLFFHDRFLPEDSDPIVMRNLKGFRVIAYDDENNPQDLWSSDDAGSDYETPVSLSILLVRESETRLSEFSGHVILRSVRKGVVE